MDWGPHLPICGVSYLLWTWTFRIGRTHVALWRGRLPAASYRVWDGAQTVPSLTPYLLFNRTLLSVVLSFCSGSFGYDEVRQIPALPRV